MKADSPAFISRVMSLLLQLQLWTQVTVVKSDKKKKFKFHLPVPGLVRAKGTTHPFPSQFGRAEGSQHWATPNVSAETLEELKEPQNLLSIRSLPRAVD